MAIGTDHQRNVGESRRAEAKRFIEKQLTRRRGQQIITPDDLGYALSGIVRDDG
jgi:hypothetical protein